MHIFSWLYKPSKEITEAREAHRINRGQLATKVTQLDEHRHLLDEMVKRSLELMEPKK